MALPDHPAADGRGQGGADDIGLRILSVLTGLVVAGLLVFAPYASLNRWGEADPLAAMLLLWSMVAGFATFHALVRENPDFAFLAHPSMGGAARIAPPLLIGKLFRLLGADAVVFPSHGGRFGYTRETCAQLAANARQPWHGLAPALPVPAGGMTLARVGEILDFYGPRTMVLIGGSLLEARERLAEETAAFTRAVASHGA